MTLDALNLSSARFSHNQGRSLSGDAVGSIRYPSPFFDIASTYQPSSFKSMLIWCRYYFLTNPLVNAVCYKMAEYPVTDLVFDGENEHSNIRWNKFFQETLHYKKFEVETGLDYNTYGNAFISIYYPFKKHLVCKSCGKASRVQVQKYIFREYKFLGTCQRCRHYGEFDVRDYYVKSPREIRLIRWNPEYITIQHNEATGESRYYYSIPPTLANDVRMAKRHIIESIPQTFIEALRKNKALLFSKQNIYHMQRPTIAQKDRGWGMPMILPVLKDIFYLQVLRKAQECVSPDSLIETSLGLVRADDIKVGNCVRTHTGAFHPVEEKWYRSSREEEIGIKLTPTGLRAFPSVYSPHHPILTIRRNEENRRIDTKDRQISRVILRNPHLYEEVICPADQIQVGDYVLYPRYLPSSTQSIDVTKYTGLTSTKDYVYSGCGLETAQAFEKLEQGEKVKHDNAGRTAKRNIKRGSEPKRMASSLDLTEDLAYVLGWYAGDGSCGARHVEFSIGQTDPKVYDENLKKAIHKVFGIQCTGTETESVRHLTACCVIMEKLFRGVIPGPAKEKRAPVEILNSPKPVKLAFLRGLFESDGCFGTAGHTLNIHSPNLSYDTYRLLISLGCIATVSKRKTKPSMLKDGRVIKEGIAYPLDITTASKNRLDSLWECGEGQEIISGKSGFFFGNYFATRVSAIEEVEEDTYIDFRVAKDTTFCLPGTATKNSIAVEHVVPMRILFPQAASGSADPYSTINLSSWRDKVEQELVRWRLDNNYIPLLPVPIGQQSLGGDGRALMLSQEYRQWSEQIIAGLGVPIEFIYGGMAYCLQGLTRINTSKGLMNLQDVVKEELSSSILTQEGPRKITGFHKAGVKPAVKLRTRLGFELEGAETHPLLSLRPDLSLQYKTLSELEEGDFVVTKAGGNLWPKKSPKIPVNRGRPYQTAIPVTLPKFLTKDMARLLGYLVSEGYISNERFTFSNTNYEVFEDYMKCFESTFGYRPSVEDKALEGYKPSKQVAVWRVEAIKILRRCGFDGHSKDKVVPWLIKSAPKDMVASFLRGYFEGDGGLRFKQEGGGDLAANSASKELLQDIQLLLLNFGIVSSLYGKSEASPIYKIAIRCKENLTLFQKDIGFASSVKSEALKSLINISAPEDLRIPYVRDRLREFRDRYRIGNNNWQWAPFKFTPDKPLYTIKECSLVLDRMEDSVREHIKRGRLKASKNGVKWEIKGSDLANFCKAYGRGIIVPFPRLHKNATRYNMEKVKLDFVQEKEPKLAERIEALLSNDFRFDEILKIEEADPVEMYDLTIEGTHSYLSNGIVSHNSGSNVSMRILENHFLDVKSQRKDFVQDFLIPNIGAFLDWDPVSCHYKRFKMADDLQRSAFYLQLNQAGKLSDRSLLEDTDWESLKEQSRIEEERKRILEGQRRQALSQASIQGEAQMIMAKYQMRGQKMMTEMQMGPEAEQQGMPPAEPMPGMGQPGAASPVAEGQMMNQQGSMQNTSGQTPGMEIPPAAPMDPSQSAPPGMEGVQSQVGESPPPIQGPGGLAMGATTDLMLVAQKVVAWLNTMQDQERQHHLVKMQINNPQLYSLILPMLQQSAGAQQNSAAMPVPEQQPARRGPESQQGV